jgi:hypothetical protein
MLLAAALSNPEVAHSWITHLPVNRELLVMVKEQMPPTEFAEVWARGQTLDVRATAAELSEELANQVVKARSLQVLPTTGE